MPDFDQIIDRQGTNTVKHERIGTMCAGCDMPEDVIPLWVADMDFATPSFIIDALRRRLEHPVLGYTELPAEMWPTVAAWQQQLHGWHTEAEWYHFIPGIVKGIGLVVNCFLRPGDKVIIQPPVYHPFRLVPEGNGIEVVNNPLTLLPDGSYAMDLDGLERIIDPHCKLLILCNPHNPAGVLWDADTLRRLAMICHRHGIMVISDEIHADMALWGRSHHPFASVSPEAAECSITFGAPSKTFNMAGMISSWCAIPSPTLRRRFYTWLDANELAAPDIMAPIATLAAYSPAGAEWRSRMLGAVERNVAAVERYCAKQIPAIRPLRPQASFLMWLDCRQLPLEPGELHRFFVEKAGLLLNDGAMFGPGGAGFMRLNVGAPHATIIRAMERLSRAVDSFTAAARP